MAWLSGGRAHGLRIEALERQVADLTTAMTTDAKRIDDLSGGLNSLSERLTGVARALTPVEQRIMAEAEEVTNLRATILSIVAAEVERARELSTTVGSLSKAVAAVQKDAGSGAMSGLERRMKEDREEAVKMRTAIQRLERQLDLYAEDARRTGAGLLERIEAMTPEIRRGSTPPVE
jgi:chromosome segregation ATPase